LDETWFIRCEAMRLLHHNVFLRLFAALAMLLFAGDLAADAIADLTGGHCDSQTSQSPEDHGKAPCTHCACAVHAGAVVIPDLSSAFESDLRPLPLDRSVDDGTPPRLASSIDHPPQLA
jgi:hypothetical protein